MVKDAAASFSSSSSSFFCSAGTSTGNGSSSRDRPALDSTAESQTCSNKSDGWPVQYKLALTTSSKVKEAGSGLVKEKPGPGPASRDNKHAVFDRLSGQAQPYVFRHLADVTRYMSEYRERYAVGQVCRKARRWPVLGVDVPDPYTTSCRRRKPRVCAECSPLSQSKMAANFREGASVDSGSSCSGKDILPSAARNVPNLAPVRSRVPVPGGTHSLMSQQGPPLSELPQPATDLDSVPSVSGPSVWIQQESQPTIGQPASLQSQPVIGQSASDQSQPTIGQAASLQPQPMIGQSASLQSQPVIGQSASFKYQPGTVIGQTPDSIPTGSQPTMVPVCSLSSLGLLEGVVSQAEEGNPDSHKNRKSRKKGHVKLRHSSCLPAVDVTQEPHVTSDGSQRVTISVPVTLTRQERGEEEEEEGGEGGKGGKESGREPWLPGIVGRDVSENKGRQQVVFRRDGFLDIALARKIYQSKLTPRRPRDSGVMLTHRLADPDHRRLQNEGMHKLSRAQRSRSMEFLAHSGREANSQHWKSGPGPGGLLKVHMLSVDNLPVALDGWTFPCHTALPRIPDPLVPPDRWPHSSREEGWGQRQVEVDHQTISQQQQQQLSSSTLAESRDRELNRGNYEAEEKAHGPDLHLPPQADQCEKAMLTSSGACGDLFHGSDSHMWQTKDLTPWPQRGKNVSMKTSNRFPSSSCTTTTTSSSTASGSDQNKERMGVRGRMVLDLGNVRDEEADDTSSPNTTTTAVTVTAKDASTFTPQIPPLQSGTSQSCCFPAKHSKRLPTFYRPPGKDDGRERNGRGARRHLSSEGRVPLSTIDPESLVITGGTLLVDCGPKHERSAQKAGETSREKTTTRQGQGREPLTCHSADDALPATVAFRLPKEAVSSLDRKDHVTVVR